MGWNLTEEEQGEIMAAVAKVINPHRTTAETSVRWQNEDGSIEDRPVTVHGVLPKDMEPALKALGDCYDDICDRGCCIGGGWGTTRPDPS